MDVLVLVFVGVAIGGAWSAPTPHVAPPELVLQTPIQGLGPVTYISRHHAQDELGQVNYGFSHPGQAKNEVRDASGNVAGSYTYVDADDKVVVVEYTAGEDGFQVKSNNLPVGVQDTPEVLAAKLQFVEQYNAAALAAADAVDDTTEAYFQFEYSEGLNPEFPVQVTSNPVRDTAEVLEAKIQFVEAYNAAALAAAYAPDDPAASPAFQTKTSVNPNSVRDTPEVLSAKLQFVEAYNAAALAAAKAAENPSGDASRVTIVYAIPAVKDTPEVRAARLQFVELYNAAALAAAAAPDGFQQTDATEEPVAVTEIPLEPIEPVTEIGNIFTQGPEVTLSPTDEEDVEPTTIFPIRQKEESKAKKIHALVPTKVESPVAVYKQSVTAPEATFKVPQAHSYGVDTPFEPLPVRVPAFKTSVLPATVPKLHAQDQAVVVPADFITRHHAQDELGRVNYGFSHPGQTKNELRDASGNVAGAYTYIDDENKEIRVEYTAGEDGFQVRSNNLPIAVHDTPEVLAAKLLFVEAYNAAALAAAVAPDDEETRYGIVPNSPAFVIPTPVQDTPAVLAAKMAFVEAYNAAALAAANAPDDPIEYAAAEPKTETYTNPNLVTDTPEVTEAKLKFVEAYNAAALAAATAPHDPEHDDTSRATLVYAPHPVQDTPEVIAAKIQFVEAYNAAALAAALAPDDDVQQTGYEVGVESAVPPTLFVPADVKIVPDAPLQEGTHILVPTLLSDSSGISTNKLPEPVFNVAEEVLPAVHTYSADPSVLPSPAESPVVAQPVLPPPAIIEVPVQGASVAVPVTYISRHHAQDELGQVNYGFSHPGQAKNEVRDAAGNVAGAYTYIDSDDKVVRVEYTAGEDGFQVKSNNLPIATGDTPEVLKAKMEFVEAYNAIALAAAAAPDDEEIAGSSSSSTTFALPVPVVDTPEVLAAKLQFVEAYNKAALAAANAPYDPIETTSDVYKSESRTLVSPNPVRDTPEVVTAKLQFVEAYNAAALAAATASDNPESEGTSNIPVVYAAHAVQDTPEVIAAKLQFVEAYNAAALAAALAPDDVVTYAETEESEDSEFVTELGEVTTAEVLTKNPQEMDSQNLNINFIQSDDDLDEAAPSAVSDIPSTELPEAQFQTVPLGAASSTRYAPYLPGGKGTVPALYIYSIPYGTYGFPSKVTSNFRSLPQTEIVEGSPPNPSIVPVQFLHQNSDNSNQVLMYAPSYTAFYA